MNVFVTGGSGFLGRHLVAALRTKGHSIRALARSDSSAAALTQAGAQAVRGDLSDVAALTGGMAGCEWVFHAAASVAEWEPWAESLRVTVEGTRNVLEAARAAKVRRLVHVGTEAVLAGGPPIVQADESWPTPNPPTLGYPRAKAMAEALVLAANGQGLETVGIRPRFIWGPDDTSLLAKFVGAVKQGRFMWVDGGHYATSTCHVDNVCEGALLSAERGRPGEVYFLTDGPPVEFRSFLTALLRTQGVEPSGKSIPFWLASGLANAVDPLWRLLGIHSPPPISKVTVQVVAREVTVSDSKARRELGYQGLTSREQGLARMGLPSGLGSAA
jgi:nucleoside-diphosphate-sugar epimerase